MAKTLEHIIEHWEKNHARKKGNRRAMRYLSVILAVLVVGCSTQNPVSPSATASSPTGSTSPATTPTPGLTPGLTFKPTDLPGINCNPPQWGPGSTAVQFDPAQLGHAV